MNKNVGYKFHYKGYKKPNLHVTYNDLNDDHENTKLTVFTEKLINYAIKLND